MAVSPFASARRASIDRIFFGEIGVRPPAGNDDLARFPRPIRSATSALPDSYTSNDLERRSSSASSSRTVTLTISGNLLETRRTCFRSVLRQFKEAWLRRLSALRMERRRPATPLGLDTERTFLTNTVLSALDFPLPIRPSRVSDNPQVILRPQLRPLPSHWMIARAT